MLRFCLLFTCLGALAFGFSAQASSKSVGDNDFLSKMDSVARVLSGLDGEIRVLYLNQAAQKDSLNVLDAAVTRQSLVVAALDSQYRILEAERQPLVRVLSRSLMADRRLGKWAMLDVLLGSKNLADFLTRRAAMVRLKDAAKRRAIETAHGLAAIKFIEDKSLDEVKQLDKAKRQIEIELAEYAKRESELAKKRGLAVAQRDLLVREQGQLEKRSDLVLEQLAEKSEALGKVANIVEEQASKAVSSGTFVSLRGLLPWPIQGSLVSRFGKKRHKELETITENPGVDIESELGAPVKAVASGKVTTVTWMRGFGNICIVQHEGDHHTVYARLAEVLVRQDDVIDSNTIMGYPGFDPERGDYALHFEVWAGREKQDPLTWLAPAKTQQ